MGTVGCWVSWRADVAGRNLGSLCSPRKEVSSEVGVRITKAQSKGVTLVLPPVWSLYPAYLGMNHTSDKSLTQWFVRDEQVHSCYIRGVCGL